MVIHLKILLKKLKRNLIVEKARNLHTNQKNLRIFGMYLEKQLVFDWNLKKNPHQNLFHIISLDINLLHYYLLRTHFRNVGDPRYDQ